jgi:dTDP-4-dehydrorhamnose reductase
MLGRMVTAVLRTEGVPVDASSRARSGDRHRLDAAEGLHGLRALFRRGGQYAYIINCIGITKADITESDSQSVQQAVVVNALFPHALSHAARETGASVIHLSTDGVFSGRGDEYFEDAAHDCTDVYGKTKSLGEVRAPGFLTIRCSIVGPDPAKRRGLLEWLRAQPAGAVVEGYEDQLWSGVTTLQFARLCQELIGDGRFRDAWEESPVHHYCPNEPVSKYELLQIFRTVYALPITVMQSRSERPVRRILRTRYRSLRDITAHRQSLTEAVRDLAEFGPRLPAAT